jgi:neutral ceramidase
MDDGIGVDGRGATLTAGVARVVITPPVGIALTGFAGRPASDGIHDDLLATALVLAERRPDGDDQDSRVALVTLDLLGMYGDQISPAIKAQVEHVTGISAGRIFLSCTHTHYGPVV